MLPQNRSLNVLAKDCTSFAKGVAVDGFAGKGI